MAFLHHLAAFTLVGVLLYEHTAFRKDLTFAEARRLQRMDALYGISAAILLVVGILRVIYFEKGAAFYTQNWFFWTKMIGFALAGLLSIYPTVRFVSWNKSFANNQTPVISDQEATKIKMILRLELLGIVIIILSAALMARGVGMMT